MSKTHKAVMIAEQKQPARISVLPVAKMFRNADCEYPPDNAKSKARNNL